MCSVSSTMRVSEIEREIERDRERKKESWSSHGWCKAGDACMSSHYSQKSPSGVSQHLRQ